MENISHIGYTEEKVATYKCIPNYVKHLLGLIFVFLTHSTVHGVQFLNRSYSLFS